SLFHFQRKYGERKLKSDSLVNGGLSLQGWLGSSRFKNPPVRNESPWHGDARIRRRMLQFQWYRYHRRPHRSQLWSKIKRNFNRVRPSDNRDTIRRPGNLRIGQQSAVNRLPLLLPVAENRTHHELTGRKEVVFGNGKSSFGREANGKRAPAWRMEQNIG